MLLLIYFLYFFVYSSARANTLHPTAMPTALMLHISIKHKEQPWQGLSPADQVGFRHHTPRSLFSVWWHDESAIITHKARVFFFGCHKSASRNNARSFENQFSSVFIAAFAGDDDDIIIYFIRRLRRSWAAFCAARAPPLSSLSTHTLTHSSQ